MDLRSAGKGGEDGEGQLHLGGCRLSGMYDSGASIFLGGTTSEGRVALAAEGMEQ